MQVTARTLTAPAPVADAGGVPCASVAPVEAPQIEREFESEIEASPSRAWATVVWNDPINLMSYVTWVFMTHFGYDRAHAETLMWQVHTAGKSKVSEGGRERMEADVAALHSYGLWATLEECG